MIRASVRGRERESERLVNVTSAKCCNLVVIAPFCFVCECLYVCALFGCLLCHHQSKFLLWGRNGGKNHPIFPFILTDEMHVIIYKYFNVSPSLLKEFSFFWAMLLLLFVYYANYFRYITLIVIQLNSNGETSITAPHSGIWLLSDYEKEYNLIWITCAKNRAKKKNVEWIGLIGIYCDSWSFSLRIIFLRKIC